MSPDLKAVLERLRQHAEEDAQSGFTPVVDKGELLVLLAIAEAAADVESEHYQTLGRVSRSGMAVLRTALSRLEECGK